MKLTQEHKLYLEFAIGCALKVLPIWEKKYPDKKEPRKALEAALAFFLNPTEANRKAADAADAAAADAAYDAADAAYAAAADAAYAAADAAYDAAADAAYDAAADAAYAATYAAYAATYAAYAATYAAALAAERKWQSGFLAYLNFKYSLSVKIRGVE